MKIYRIAKKQYINDLSGEGARLYGGRWNKKGDAMLYFSESLSLCVLEILVHLDFQFLSNDFYFVEAEIPDEMIQPTFTINDLDTIWNNNPPSPYTQQIGSDWLTENKNLAMRVPSAVLPVQANILVNPKHLQMSKLNILKSESLQIDQRVFR